MPVKEEHSVKNIKCKQKYPNAMILNQEHRKTERKLISNKSIDKTCARKTYEVRSNIKDQYKSQHSLDVSLATKNKLASLVLKKHKSPIRMLTRIEDPHISNCISIEPKVLKRKGSQINTFTRSSSNIKMKFKSNAHKKNLVNATSIDLYKSIQVWT